jgi:hypothetical protein
MSRRSAISKKESSTPSKTTLAKIAIVFESANIQFTEGNGVRTKSSSITYYYGRTGYRDFYEDIYNTLRLGGGDIYVSNVDEILFTDWLGMEGTQKHKQRMMELWSKKPFTFQILIEEGDRRFAISEVAEYKWTQKSRFADIPFYIYGSKLAIILFEPDDVNVHVIHSMKIVEAYRKQFKVIWDQGIPIPKSEQINIEKFRT